MGISSEHSSDKEETRAYNDDHSGRDDNRSNNVRVHSANAMKRRTICAVRAELRSHNARKKVDYRAGDENIKFCAESERLASGLWTPGL